MIAIHFGTMPAPDWLFFLALVVAVIILLWKVVRKPLLLLAGLIFLIVQLLWYVSRGRWGEFKKKYR